MRYSPPPRLPLGRTASAAESKAGIRTSRSDIVRSPSRTDGPVAARYAHDRRLPGHRSGPVPDSHRLPDYPREGHLRLSCRGRVYPTPPCDYGSPPWVLRSPWSASAPTAGPASRRPRGHTFCGADVLLGGRRHLASGAGSPARSASRGRPRCSPGLDDVLARYAGRSIVVLASGDPLVSGIGSRLIRHARPRRGARDSGGVVGRTGPCPDGLGCGGLRDRHSRRPERRHVAPVPVS